MDETNAPPPSLTVVPEPEAAPAPVAEPAPDKERPAVSQGFLDARRAMVLKWATRKGTYKDGKPVTDEDRAWYAKWEADHPPKATLPAPKLGAVRGEEAEAPHKGPMPRPPAPPRVDPDPPRPPKGEKKDAWQDSYKKLAADSFKLPTIKLPNGRIVNERELVCLAVAGIGLGILKSCEDALATIGAKPYFGITVETLEAPAVLMADKYLPEIARAKPEHILAVGVAAIVAPRIFKHKEIAARAKQLKAEKDHQGKLAELRTRTERDEVAFREAEATREAQARANATRAAAPVATTPAPREEIVVVKHDGEFASPSEAQQEKARATFDIHAEVKLPEGHII